ncbi:MAG: hypothetical protein WAO19_04105, partial [Candidatus Kryptoniota bacterium]
VIAFNSTVTVSTKTDGTGAFMLMQIPPGTYTLRVVPSDTMLNDTTISNVHVTDGGTINLNTIQVSGKQ